MTDVPRTSPERPIIWSLGRLTTGPVDVPWIFPFRTFEYLFFPVKSNNTCAKQGLLNTFFIKLSIIVLVALESPEGPLEVPRVRIFRVPSEDNPRTSLADRVSG